MGWVRVDWNKLFEYAKSAYSKSLFLCTLNIRCIQSFCGLPPQAVLGRGRVASRVVWLTSQGLLDPWCVDDSMQHHLWPSCQLYATRAKKQRRYEQWSLLMAVILMILSILMIHYFIKKHSSFTIEMAVFLDTT